MSTTQSSELSLDDLLGSVSSVLIDNSGIAADGTIIPQGLPFEEPGYEGSIDYRIRQLSYSSLLTLHSCPRKYELYKKRAKSQDYGAADNKSGITFDYGHIVGEGIQLVMQDMSLEQIYPRMLPLWNQDLWDINEKQNKSFWLALQAVKRFSLMRQAGFLEDYELVYYQGKPAVELSFCIVFPDGFRYRGHVDAVLKHKITGKIIVLECKTSSIAVQAGTYKNSAQAIGYSIVLDAIFPSLSAYEVLYLIYHSKDCEYTVIPFPKTYHQRAVWIQELLLDIEMIKMYEEHAVYPMHGESCMDWGRECEYMQVCTLNTAHITKPMDASFVDHTEYQITLSLEDLLTTQLAKAE